MHPSQCVQYSLPGRLIGAGNRMEMNPLCQIRQGTGVRLGAAVQELEDSVMCVFILQLIGDDESIRKAEEQIDKNGVLRERMEVE